MAQQQPPLAVCIPLNVDAFILNENIVNSGKSLIAPFSLPDYGGLEPGDRLQHDVIPHLELRSATLSKTNERLSDLDSGEPRQDRLGVYLHWTIPKPFRAGVAATGSEDALGKEQRRQKGLSEDKRKTTTGSTEFVAVPDRWVVIRHIHTANPAPEPYGKFSAFVVESNRIRRLDREEFDALDLDTEAAPFVDHKGTTDAQHGVFLGAKYHLQDWQGMWDPAAVESQNFHIPLTIADSANPLFTDFQHHCMNVFAMHDDLTYYSLDKNQLCTLESADISYLVVGYHGLKPYDPLANGETTSNNALLSAHGMKLKLEQDVEWLGQEVGRNRIRSLCHGTADHIFWSLKEKPAKIPADEAADNFAQKHPVAIGTDLLDALTASYLAPADPSKADKKLAAAFKHLEILAANPSDDGEGSSQGAQQKANHFKPAHGGHIWTLKKDSNDKHGIAAAAPVPAQASAAATGVPTQAPTTDPKDTAAGESVKASTGDDKPPQETLQMLHDLNATQRLLDSATRHYNLHQHLLFCEWWKARAAGYGNAASSTDDIDDGFNTMRSWYKDNLNKTRARMREILTKIIKLDRGDQESGIVPMLIEHIGQLSPEGSRTAKTPDARFFSARDPTIILSDMDSSWPAEFTQDSVPVQLNTQLSDRRDLTYQNEEWQVFQGQLANLPPWVHACIDDLRHDWLQPEVQKDTSATVQVNAPASQAWFPLFIEWEADYFHVPMRHWILKETNDGTVKYCINHKANLTGDPEITKSCRGLSGRSAILPEGSRSLGILVDQVIRGSSPDDLKKILGEQEEQIIRDAVAGVDNILSAELDGIGDHLLTLVRGTHATANPAESAQISSWLSSLFPYLSANDCVTVVKSLATGVGADVTPYTKLLPVQGVSRSTNGSLFRPVTHGQIQFTKLNIVDKFGQVVSAFDPRPGQPFRPIYPSISDDLACQRSSLPGRVFANTALPEPEGRCQFFQLGPRVNQDIRFNSAFVVQEAQTAATNPDTSPASQTAHWRPLLEWENPIWGWVVCNFQDDSLQVFQGDGTLCGEVLVGAATTKALWLNPDADTTHAVPPVKSPELAKFMERLSSSNDFLHSVWNMVVDANEHIHHAPSTLADFLPALIGRPLALVSMGWSLELATQPMVDQTDSGVSSEMSLLDYQFDLKLGDQMSLHDGLIAYFDEDTDAAPEASSFNFDAIFTTYGLSESKRGLRKRKGLLTLSQPSSTIINDSTAASVSTLPVRSGKVGSVSSSSSGVNTPSGSTVSEQEPIPQVLRAQNVPFTPYWIDPMDYCASKIEDTKIDEFTKAHHRKFRVFGALVDPFQSINGFSGILPTTSLTVPPWALDSALKKMGTFMRAGPLLIPGDIPAATSTDAVSTVSTILSSSSITATPATANTANISSASNPSASTAASVASSTTTRPSLPIDAPAEGSWTWVQPVLSNGDNLDNSKFDLIPTSKQFAVPEGPQTAVEGFLRLDKQ